MQRHYWTDEEKKWLAGQDTSLSYKELTKLYNDRFSGNLTVLQVQEKAAKLNLKRERKYHQYTEEEKEWLIGQDTSLTIEELTKRFNERFNESLSVSQISDLVIKRLKVRRSGNSGQFQIGPRPKYKVGDEIIKAGYIYVKIDDHYKPGKSTSEDYKRNWKRKANLVWEKEYGEIPEGQFLIFLDGNTLNCDITNLYPVTRAVHAVMTSNHWYKLNREFTLGALKYCELLQAKRGK